MTHSSRSARARWRCVLAAGLLLAGSLLLAAGPAVSPAHAEDASDAPTSKAAPTLAQLATAWWAEDDPVARGGAALGMVVQAPEPDAFLAAMQGARVFSGDVPKGTVHEWKRPAPDDKESTCYLLVPKTYKPETPMRLMVWLHGGVGREQDGGGRSGLRLMTAHAAKSNFLLLCPSTRKGGEWWTPAGCRADPRRRC